MSPIDALWHLLNLFALPAMTALLASGAAKLLWRRELAGRTWWRLAWPAVLASAAVTLGGLLLLGQDGRIATYGVMVAACALTLWWRGFVFRR